MSHIIGHNTFLHRNAWLWSPCGYIMLNIFRHLLASFFDWMQCGACFCLPRIFFSTSHPLLYISKQVKTIFIFLRIKQLCFFVVRFNVLTERRYSVARAFDFSREQVCVCVYSCSHFVMQCRVLCVINYHIDVWADQRNWNKQTKLNCVHRTTILDSEKRLATHWESCEHACMNIYTHI